MREKRFEIAKTELDEDALMYYIDIGRHGLSDEDYINEFKKIEAYLTVNKKEKIQAYKQINLDKGIDHSKEYSEVALLLTKSIVFHRENSRSKDNQLIR